MHGKIQKTYLCMYPDCNKRYVRSDGLQRHCKKNHRQWIKGKKIVDYGFEIPVEYEGDDYVTDYMSMVNLILADDNTTSSLHDSSPCALHPTTLLFPTVPFVLVPPPISLNISSMTLNICIDFFVNLFCEENI